jgi:hypothetical protein
MAGNVPFVASEWRVVKRADGNWEVWWRDCNRGFDVEAMLNDLRRDGWSEEQLASERAAAERSPDFTRCNETPEVSRKACWDFVLAYSKPGDWLVLEGVRLVFCEPARA